jgi:hypothetical protein
VSIIDSGNALVSPRILLFVFGGIQDGFCGFVVATILMELHFWRLDNLVLVIPISGL